MKRILTLFTLSLAPAAAQVQSMPPATQAMQQTIIKLTGESLEWQTKALELQAQVNELQKQVEAAKKPAEPKTEP